MLKKFEEEIKKARNCVELSTLVSQIDFELFIKHGVQSEHHETYLETANRISGVAPAYANLFSLAETKWFEFA